MVNMQTKSVANVSDSFWDRDLDKKLTQHWKIYVKKGGKFNFKVTFPCKMGCLCQENMHTKFERNIFDNFFEKWTLTKKVNHLKNPNQKEA